MNSVRGVAGPVSSVFPLESDTVSVQRHVVHANFPVFVFTFGTRIWAVSPATGSSFGATCTVTETPLFVAVWCA